MDLDLAFPALARLAVDKGTSLGALADSAQDHPGYLLLTDCCQMAQRGVPRWSHADNYDYLATLNVFLEEPWIEERHRKVLWEKIIVKQGSQFLDSVAEAAWALHFRDRGVLYEFEARFDPLSKTSKDAEFRLGPLGQALWLDVSSMEVGPPDAPEVRLPRQAYPSHSRDSVVSLVVRKAVNKYKSKFKPAVLEGPLKEQPVGILLGLLKAERNLLPGLLFDMEAGHPIPAPPRLFSDENPGLAIVWVFNLTRAESGAYLMPNLIFPWCQPDVEGLPILKLLQPGPLTFDTKPLPLALSGILGAEE